MSCNKVTCTRVLGFPVLTPISKGMGLIAQAMGGSIPVNGFPKSPPAITGTKSGDTGTLLRLAIDICCAFYHCAHNGGKGQYVEKAMQKLRYEPVPCEIP